MNSARICWRYTDVGVGDLIFANAVSPELSPRRKELRSFCLLVDKSLDPCGSEVFLVALGP
jgi:hypothetical protein